MIRIEVAYALPDKQSIISVELEQSQTVEAVIRGSGILDIYPEIDLTEQAVGIFGQIVSLSTVVEAGDRVEIYRPLILDPMEARRIRASKQQKPRRVNRKRPSNGVVQQVHDCV